MRERVRQREREEGPGPRPGYELCFKRRQTFVERQHRGKVVVWPHEREWDVSRQGKIMWFLHPGAYKDTCLQDWYVFVQEIPRVSGKHRHQGGLVIFALEGEGTTTMDDVPHHWEAGDLLILPVKEGGVVHQHFNRRQDGQSSFWLAFINDFIWDHVGSEMEQLELSPLWLEQQGQARGR